MSHSIKQSTIPHVSVYEYPEDLNPFKDEGLEQVELRKSYNLSNNETSKAKENKQKFWTFGKSRRKRSNSFSIKSTWNGIFGKRKDYNGNEKKSAITTVSSTYNRNTTCNPETATSHISTDEQEFNQALWTLSRRRKYTLDNSSRYSSSLTVNSDSKRIYDGCPQETTTSIMGNLTPKPPIRRFGQGTSKSDEIPPLNYHDDCHDKDGEIVDNYDIPVPPKRSGIRSSQRLHVPLDNDEHNLSIKSDTMIDENENIHDDYIFKRFNHNAMQKSNLSINSCLSLTSVYHSGRKKRRAPQPPIDPNINISLDDSKNEINIHTDNTAIDNRNSIVSIDIVKAAEDIDEMTKRNQNIDDDSLSLTINNSSISLVKNEKENLSSSSNLVNDCNDINNDVIIVNNGSNVDIIHDNINNSSNDATPVEIELKKDISECVEIVKHVDIIDDIDDSVVLRKRESLGNLSSSESFCVKQEIEKIERQIKFLEANKVRSRTCSLSYNNTDNYINDNNLLQRCASRRSLQESRRNFFTDLTRNNNNDRVKIEIKELPREQNDIKIVRLSESPTSNTSTAINIQREKPVKVIELHITEPIKQKPDFIVTETNINPIPKPRRHNTHQRHNNQFNTDDSHIINDDEDEMSANSI